MATRRTAPPPERDLSRVQWVTVNARDLARGENIETRWAEFGRVDPLAVEERRAAIVQALSAAGLAVEGIVTLPALGYSEEEQVALLQQDVVNGVGQ